MKYIALIALVAVSACKEERAEIPAAVTMSADALGHFCQMNIADHPGPKGQIHLAGLPDPIFFGQVRDMIAYLKSSEREADVLAIYVSDMGVEPTWRSVAPDNWVAATEAVYVIDAGVAGGMGAPEIVPFSGNQAAEAFVAKYGGEIVPYAAIPDAVALGSVDLDIELDHPA